MNYRYIDDEDYDLVSDQEGAQDAVDQVNRVLPPPYNARVIELRPGEWCGRVFKGDKEVEDGDPVVRRMFEAMEADSGIRRLRVTEIEVE